MINRVIATSDVNKDGKVNKLELFTLFKTLLSTNFDNNVFGNYPQQNVNGNQGTIEAQLKGLHFVLALPTAFYPLLVWVDWWDSNRAYGLWTNKVPPFP